MRAIVTGQVGLDKGPFLEQVAERAGEAGFPTAVYHVGQRMYAEAPDVAAGRILDLPLSRLSSLRRAVFKDILAEAPRQPNLLVNTHATFRWRHGLFHALDHDHLQALAADAYVCLVDSIDTIHARLIADGHRDHTLKDLMVWREEELMATELLSQVVGGHGCFFIQARGFDDSTAEALFRLLYRPEMRKVYLSFPMSHVANVPETLAVIENFRRQMKNYFTCFDPGDLEEKHLCELALDALQQGHRTVTLNVKGQPLTVDAAELGSIIGDIDGQIYARDFKLIDQADMILSLIPERVGGGPALSSGVERELQHAHEATKDVFVVWLPEAQPSPFITETATRVFHSTAEAIQFFLDNGYVGAPRGGLFA